jgi:predicted Zn-dependent protease with MMP-like domain
MVKTLIQVRQADRSRFVAKVPFDGVFSESRCFGARQAQNATHHPNRSISARNAGRACKFNPRKALKIVYMTLKGVPMARIDQTDDWRTRHAPTISAFESLALEAYGHLPEEFRALTGNLIIEIAEFPSDDVFEDMALETPFDLLGLFEGRGISERFTVETGEMPNRITLYRRPILDYWAENEETLGDIITHVLIHEIGHHFGLSDDDMERIEASAEIAAG